MKVFRIDISAWTASFRYPNLISGVQPTLDVPPISTVLGLLNAASGQYLKFNGLELGYYFEYSGKAFDLETIYMVRTNSHDKPTNNAKSNIINREFMVDAKLSLYLKDKSVLNCLKNPFYDILLGRSGDLAKVSIPYELNLQQVQEANKIKGQVIPFRDNFLPGKIQALPRYFTNDFPRKNLGTEPFTIIPFHVRDFTTSLVGYRDESQGKRGVDIFFHKIDYNIYD